LVKDLELNNNKKKITTIQVKVMIFVFFMIIDFYR